MKISIITVVYNNKDIVMDAMNSVLSQEYGDLEYVIVDGASTDGTIETITEAVKKYPEGIIKVVSEKDDGIYDAMNKGIRLASGDIIGILNSDDFYIDKDVISTVSNEFMTKETDSVFADLVYVRTDDLNKIVRYYSSASFYPKKWNMGGCRPTPPFSPKKRYMKNMVCIRLTIEFQQIMNCLPGFCIKIMSPTVIYREC